MCQWLENVVHHSGSKASKYYDPVEHQREVIPTDRVVSRGSVVVRKLEELSGMSPSSWEAEMRQCKQHEQVHSET